jgi:hypothetical protein
VRDPNEVYETLNQLTDDRIRSCIRTDLTKNCGIWDRETRVPEDLPFVAAIPFPSTPSSDLQAPVKSYLGLLAMWGGAGPDLRYLEQAHEGFFCHRFGLAADTVVPGATVRGAIVYQLGECSRVIPLAPILQQVTSDVWFGFEDNAIKAGAITRSLTYSKSVAFVHHTVGNDSDVSGGFFYAFHFGANDSDLWGTYRYRFALDQSGVVGVEPEEVAFHATGSLGPELGPGIGIPGLQPRLAKKDGDLATRFRAMALSLQTIPNPSMGAALANIISSNECASDDPSALAESCAGAADALGAVVVSGVGNSWTDDDKAHGMCSFGASGCRRLGIDPNPILARRWRCVADAGDPQRPYCHFIVPVKRLNPMSDQLETVFYDGPEVDNPAFWLGQYAKGQPGNALCEPPRGLDQHQWIAHPYAKAQYP